LGSEARGLWRSGDGGFNWSAVSLNGSTSSTVISVAADPSDPLRVFAGHGRARVGIPSAADQSGAHISIDGGVSWRPVLEDVRDVTGMTALATDPGVAYAAGWGRGLFGSFDGGRSWQSVPGPATSGAAGASAHLLTVSAVHPRGSGACEVLLAGGSDGLWARNAAGVRYHTIYLPSTSCQSDHCRASALASRGAPADDRPPRPDIVAP
jgi:hypothetical protein